jgi:hypothetical protein
VQGVAKPLHVTDFEKILSESTSWYIKTCIFAGRKKRRFISVKKT